jgi:hypothetical protein
VNDVSEKIRRSPSRKRRLASIKNTESLVMGPLRNDPRQAPLAG